MKKIAIIIVMAMAALNSSNVSGQAKIGFISMSELIQAMPESKAADTALQQFGKDLQDQINIMQQSVQTKAADFQKNSATWTDAMKQVKTRDLQSAQQNLTDFQQAANQKFSDKRDSLLKPIVDKAKLAVAAVAKDKGYSYVIDNSGDILLAKPDGDDLLTSVKLKLGLK
ncbi:MAG TPA: OmpH family outer membrane protein [Chitinophagaceae bacterium]|nr:OmpH family outer membrane protein [Chitinophagaceae bacterium]